MQEAGIDISHHHSKTLDQVSRHHVFDHVFTVCDHASESCPRFGGASGCNPVVHHVPFGDPPQLTKEMEDEEME